VTIMNIEEPKVSRLLANLIQPIESGYRRRFIEDAQKAKNMKEFLGKYKNYKKFM
jgi:hypothetical protein